MEIRSAVLNYEDNTLTLQMYSHLSVDAALAHIKNPNPPGYLDPVQVNAYKYVINALYRSGEKIAAIRFYRQMTGLGLKAAKDACDKIAELQF